MNYGPRRLTRHRGASPSDEALIKLLYLALLFSAIAQHVRNPSVFASSAARG